MKDPLNDPAYKQQTDAKRTVLLLEAILEQLSARRGFWSWFKSLFNGQR